LAIGFIFIFFVPLLIIYGAAFKASYIKMK